MELKLPKGIKILYKTITADTQVSVVPVFFVGADLYSTTATTMVIYDEATSGVTASKIIASPGTTATNPYVYPTIPMPGIKCDGIYVNWTAGLGTVYYYLA